VRALALLLAAGCAAPAPSGIRVFGAIRDVMRDGKTGAVVALADVVPGPHAYALGALAGLRGEILVLDDHVVVSYPAGEGAVRLDETNGRAEKAALLVAAAVPRWTRVTINEDIPADAFDERIAALAANAGVDTAQRFPFLIGGAFTEVDWHVLDGGKLPPTATHDERMTAAVHGSASDVTGRALGFYSDKDIGTFTHMGSRTHVHVLLPAVGVMGHANHMAVAAGSILFVPAP
jgi:hypothetical protein